ncbi:VWA domain-containing protein [Gilvimarinus xylanilyticus]|uniref:VWA domain-containing protein n=1 Tax=Gilvimarinus xylanilyticus TaxID=2944139 RepID=A0A9X2HWS6_9GAMM|nr:VWA domain-containing protein [Gilvimarinus xylanilyticus]MCP8899575.1 VWA domain-containing protein [Gilvimarinus xylanilyticus]
MIVFKHLWLLALLPLPLLVYWLLPALRQRALAIRIPFFNLAAEVSGARVGAGSQVFGKPVWDIVAGLLIWALLVLALAEPVKLGAPVQEKVISRDIMLAIDLSGSMDEQDFPDASGAKIQRLQAVKNVVSQYIRDRREDRIGLIVFGTRAYLQVPFTQDLASAEEILRESAVSIAGPHTAIGDAIGLAIKHFESSQVEDRVLILLTDGADTGSRMSPLNAAHIAAEDGVKIFTIGIGDENGEGQYRVDFDTLRKISEITSGAFYSAQDSDALGRIYTEIDKIAATTSEKPVQRSEQALLVYPLVAALGMFILSFFISFIRVLMLERRHV